MKKLNISIPLLGVYRSGGIRVICELANGLAEFGHEISIVTPPLKSKIPFHISANVNIISRRESWLEMIGVKRICDFFFLIKMTKKSDIIITNYYLTFFIGYFLQKFFNKKNVYFIQGYEPDFFIYDPGILFRFRSFLAKITYNLYSSKKVTISRFILNKMDANSMKDIDIIHDGIDPDIFNSLPGTNNKNKLKIGTIALSEKRKGFLDFLKAIEILRLKRTDFEILLFSSEQDVKQRVDFPFEVVFPKNDIEISDCYRASDIFVSASHLEGFGLPGLEAMACGSVLVTTDSGGINEYAINDYNAFIVQVGDVEALANAIEVLLDNQILRERFKLNGIETVKEFTWMKMCINFEKLLLTI